MYQNDRWASINSFSSDYYPEWESHYAPIATNRSRLHHRDCYAPPPYTAGVPGRTRSTVYPRERPTLLGTSASWLDSISQRADAIMLPGTSTETMGNANFGYQHSAANYPIALRVRCEVKSVEATIIWDTPAFTARAPRIFTYALRVEGGEMNEVYNLANWKTRFTLTLVPGTYYLVKVQAIGQDKAVMARGDAEFKAIFNTQELRQTYDLALLYLRPFYGKYRIPFSASQRFYIFYRNKPTAYFDHVRLNDDGIMKTYRKDDNGHPASPINGEIEGLFFNARLPGGHMPKTSPFGNIRISVPAEYLFTPAHRLYFCDFYCNNATHYVTVVACLPNSLTDQYCSRWLMPLDPTNNVFLFVRPNPVTGALEHYVNGSIWVEFYYTEDVPVTWGYFDLVHSTGQSKPNGVPNNKTCTACNLYPAVSSPPPVTSSLLSFTSTGPIKRSSSSDETAAETNPRKKTPPEQKKVITSEYFNPSPENSKYSTFTRAMDSHREQSVVDGKRGECGDPSVLDVVCSLVDRVVAELDPPAQPCPNQDDDDGYGSRVVSPVVKLNTSIGPTQQPANDSGISCSLIDQEYKEKVEALWEFRDRKEALAKKVRDMEEMLNEAKKSSIELIKKIQNLD